MVHVNECCVGAAWHTAPVLVARQHGATQCGCNGLFGALARTGFGPGGGLGWGWVGGDLVALRASSAHVGVARALVGRGALVAARLSVIARSVLRYSVGYLVEAGILFGGARPSRTRQELTEVLGVARRHGDHRAVDRQELTRRRLRASAKRAADAERDLMAAAPLIARPAEHLTGHGEQDGVVVQPGARQASSLLHRLSERRERVRGHFEAQHPLARPLGCGRIGSVSGTSARYERFELADGLAAGGLDPRLLGFGDGHPRELARGAPAQGARLERVRQARQPLERFGDAQLLLRRPRAISEEAPDVFAETRVTDVDVRCRAPRTEQPAALLGVERRALASQPRQRGMRLRPVAFSV